MERQARRAQVLRHAKRIFARKGYHRTNVADIIARARIARGTFYLYFQNKKDLFEELLEQALSELTQTDPSLAPGTWRARPGRPIARQSDARAEFRVGRARAHRHPAQPFDRFRSRARRQDPGFLRTGRRAIKRSLDLGIEMNLVRNSDTRAVSYCILGGIKEMVGMLSRGNDADIDGAGRGNSGLRLRGVARPSC